jgi:hypothetical protein
LRTRLRVTTGERSEGPAAHLGRTYLALWPMPPACAAVSISAMIRPGTSSKLLLVADRREVESEAVPAIRRYRIARLRFEDRPAGDAARPKRAERR